MPWPALSRSEKWVDWSWFQNHGGVLNRAFDVDEFCANHPYVKGAIIRACWPNGAVDAHYAHYYDGFRRNGKRVAAYLWPNPTKPMLQVREDWKRALGERVPRLMGQDYEEASTFQGKSNGQLTALMQQTVDMARTHWPEQVHICYSRGSWLSSRILVGTWFHEIKWWLAHYIDVNPDPRVLETATQFAQMDAKLPIDNNFTPARGPVRDENVVGWQFTSRLQIVPRGTSDGDYFKQDFLATVYGVPGPIPPPTPPSKIPVEIHVPAGKVEVKVRET